MITSKEIQLLEDNTSRFIAEILGPRAVSVVYVCFVVLLSLDFQAIGAEVFFVLEFLPRKEWRKSINSVEVFESTPEKKKKKHTHPK